MPGDYVVIAIWYGTKCRLMLSAEVFVSAVIDISNDSNPYTFFDPLMNSRWEVLWNSGKLAPKILKRN